MIASVQSLGSMVVMVYLKIIKCQENQAVGHSELKLEEIDVLSKDISLNFFGKLLNKSTLLFILIVMHHCTP